jgi:hypothetical protein
MFVQYISRNKNNVISYYITAEDAALDNKYCDPTVRVIGRFCYELQYSTYDTIKRYS